MFLVLTRFFQALPVKMREEDKIKHMVWSFWLMLASSLICPPVWAFAAVFLLGLLKECWDFRFGSGFCFYDLLGNLIGIIAASILFNLARFTLFQQ